MTLILDENLPPRWRDYLTPFGITAIHWTEIGNIGDPDETIFNYACEHHAVIVTQDLDFTRILALRGSRLPSIIQFRIQNPIPEVIGPALVQIMNHHTDQLLGGCLVSVDLNRHRIRLLPLNK